MPARTTINPGVPLSGQCVITREIAVAEGVFAPGHLGELTQIVPFEIVDTVLAECGATQVRVRKLPARVVVYLLLAAALFEKCGYLAVWSRLTSALSSSKRDRSSPMPTIAKLVPGTYDPEQDTWELYYLPEDFTQARDLAAEHPGKLADLKELFWQEAENNQVLPLLGGVCMFFGILPPMPTATRKTYAGDVENISSAMLPRIYGRSYAIEAELEVPDGGAEGILVAHADEIGGFALWIDKHGLLHHTCAMLGIESCKQVSTDPIPTGKVTVRMRFDADETKPRTGGNVTLHANGK